MFICHILVPSSFKKMTFLGQTTVFWKLGTTCTYDFGTSEVLDFGTSGQDMEHHWKNYV